MATTRRSNHASPPKAPRPKCSHCGQFLPQERRERLTQTLVQALRDIAASGGNHQFIEVDPYRFKGTHSKLRYWGLLEEQLFVSEDPDHPQKRSGKWRVTSKGREFLAGRTQVPEVAIVCQDEVLRYEGEGAPAPVGEPVKATVEYSEGAVSGGLPDLDDDLLAALME